jgi:hypothetical protein
LIIDQLVRASRQCEPDHRRDRHDFAVVGFDDLPVAFVDHPMVSQAEKGEVWQITRSAVHPGDQVMAFAP